jgi:hypothetical protein
MHRISSNLTLPLKIFLPTLWISFFGVFTVAFLLANVEQFASFIYWKLGMLVFFLAFTALFYFTTMQLKRVEVDQNFVYASNYLKTYRYPYHNVEKMTERDMGLFTLVKVHLKVPGKFGKKIPFLLDEAMLKDFLEKNPEMTEVIKGLNGSK